MDILLNDEFDVELDDKKEVSIVDSRRDLEQSIKLMVTEYFYDMIGSVTAVNAVQKIELQAQRVAEESPYIASLEEVTAERVSDNAGTLGGIKVNLTFDNGDTEFVITD